MICPILNVFGIVLNTATYPYRAAVTACEHAGLKFFDVMWALSLMIILKFW